MRIRPFFWYLLAFVCVSVLLFAAIDQAHAPAMLQVHVDQEELTTASITTLELHLTDPQGVPIEEAHVLPDARMTNMNMQASYSNVRAIGKGQYKVELCLYMAGPWLITLHANADGFRPLAGLWVTSHNLESHHYLIDTSFIILATLLTLFTNILLLRVSFRPLFGLLATIREISAGKTQARAPQSRSDSEINELAGAFNTMLDRLEDARREQAAVILQAQEDERRRIALELHDEAGQNLTALLIHAELLQQRLSLSQATGDGEDIYQQLESGLQQLAKLTQSTLENIRVLAQQLRPSVLDDLGLLAAFRWLEDRKKVTDSRDIR